MTEGHESDPRTRFEYEEITPALQRAAPDLLWALKWAITVLETYGHPVPEDVRAAVTKAEGTKS